jgi:8-oxo-dGTP diphosphatase
MSAFTPSAIPDVYVLVRRDRELLLLLRTGTGYRDGEWGPPAGRVEPHETFAIAAARELGEEVGMTVAPAALEFRHVLDRIAADGEHWIGAFFSVDLAGSAPRNLEPDKHGDMRWFRSDELPTATIDYVRYVIDRIESGAFYSVWVEHRP